MLLLDPSVHTVDLLFLECDGDWDKHKGHCYKLYKEKKGFVEAEKSCVEEGAHLASLNSEDEFEYLLDLLW
jgi:hypothetical protein